MADTLIDGLPSAMRSRLLVETKSRSPLSAISVMEQRLFLGERLLRDTDSTSMASSIEVRLPLVDQLLFENVDRLPDRARYYPVGKKSVLRRIGLRGLDPTLFERPKTGFVLPYDRWLRTSLGKVMDRMMRDPAAIRPTGLDSEAVQTRVAGIPRRRSGTILVACVGDLRVHSMVSLLQNLSMKLQLPNGGSVTIPAERARLAKRAKIVETSSSCPPTNTKDGAEGFARGDTAKSNEGRYVLISPCRDEAEYVRQTVDSVINQTARPTKWIIVDDGSTDSTPQILAEYSAKYDWIQVVTLSDRGNRSLGPGVVQTFYAGYELINPDDYDYLCKLDVDLSPTAALF